MHDRCDLICPDLPKVIWARLVRFFPAIAIRSTRISGHLRRSLRTNAAPDTA
jgi:hypothetical protein